ncbi:TonB-dependent receptor P3 [Dyadobacter sp. CECT 9275]|uniref:TonB-dependent receptor P3 n=1 Tax=Dyadobacter helix TaxID=2822344 RepID=A0A916JAU6_9BACT|nr:SusC/RagA family TonB-linked outer membrane protein [Dyadobacter sp. CECT 9275]CAG4997224.1 TonB-dependent receptor P3 [Dyadobacter sp. CECT 9275]
MQKEHLPLKILFVMLKFSGIHIILVMLTFGMSMAKDGLAQDLLTRPISLEIRNQHIRTALSLIEKSANVKFSYEPAIILKNEKTTLVANADPLALVLDKLLTPLGLTFSVSGKYIILMKKNKTMEDASLHSTEKNSSSFSETKVSGKVTDEKGDALPGVSILIKGTGSGTITDANGKYTIDFPNTSAILVFSFVGYDSQEIETGSNSDLNISLKPSSRSFEEVVVVGYGTMKKRDILGSVATLKSDDLQKLKPASMDAALQGMASGVMVTSTGVPGAPVQVKVRGINSVSSNTDPLWIVDGIPIVTGAIGSDFNGSTNQNILSMINPADIESMQVLKDAAATSIYGSRGSNGVIVVTTKSGKKGKSTFDVDIRAGVSNWTKTDVGIASGKEFVEIMDLVRSNSRLAGPYEPVQSLGQLDTYQTSMTRAEAMSTNTRWADQISRMGSFSDVRISTSSGSEKTNSYLSLNYRKDNSNLKFGDLQTLSSNFNIKHNLLNTLSLGYRMLASYTNNNRISSGDGKQGAGGWGQVNSNALPWYKVYDPDGVNGYWNPQSMVNPLASMDPVHSENNLKALNLLTGLNADLKLPVKGLMLHGEVGLNYVNSQAASWISEKVRILGSRAQESKINSSTLNYNSYFNYDATFQNHHVNVVAGVEGTRARSHATNLTGIGLVGTFHEIGTPTTLSGSSSLGNEAYLMGIFGRANYNFKEKYYAGLSIRRDGISKFVNENRWATFLSGSLGWIISEEKFFNFEAINLLKFRGSYGQTGNTNIPTGITGDIWSNRSGDGTLQLSNSKMLTNIGNRNVKWETTSTIDFGADFGLFQNRINGSVAWYTKKVQDMLLKATVPLSAGIQQSNSIWQNIGDMKSYGLEFDIDALLISKKDFKWRVGGNFATNRNKVLALTPELDKAGNGIFPSETVREIIKTGLPLANWYMADYAGVDADKGIPMIYEIERQEGGTLRRTGKIIPATTTNQTANRMILEGKTSIPKVTGGVNTNVTYKGFNVSMFWNFAAGHYIYNRLRQSLMTPNTGLMTLSQEILTDTWRKPGDHTKYPMTTYGNSYYYNSDGSPSNVQVQYGSENITPNSLYLEKGDYLRLKSLQLGYNIPVKLAEASRIKGIYVYLSGTNLLTFTKFSGYDPEVNIIDGSLSSVVFALEMPQSRVFSVGVSAKF